eukprot:TRINITY_DN12602_c0_g1_i2.p1 TRINITY_DN12602_c0_g1~~TRINITY_DN12602_c0_g1_i2.p1  ORF type:complete len:154 (-),score=55.14 TRINITY_DN12602_c0_g1_i2:713-1174(-)
MSKGSESADWLGLDNEDVSDYNNAFKKDEFEGIQGHAMLELKKTFKGDPRFKLTKLFAGDIEMKKLPNKVKQQLTETELNDTVRKVEKGEEEIMREKRKGLEILGEIVPKSELHFSLKRMEQPQKVKRSYVTPRYDPALGVGTEFVVISQEML